VWVAAYNQRCSQTVVVVISERGSVPNGKDEFRLISLIGQKLMTSSFIVFVDALIKVITSAAMRSLQSLLNFNVVSLYSQYLMILCQWRKFYEYLVLFER